MAPQGVVNLPRVFLLHRSGLLTPGLIKTALVPSSARPGFAPPGALPGRLRRGEGADGFLWLLEICLNFRRLLT